MAPVLQSEAMSHNESEPDYEAIPCHEAGVRKYLVTHMTTYGAWSMHVHRAGSHVGTYVGFLQWT